MHTLIKTRKDRTRRQTQGGIALGDPIETLPVTTGWIRTRTALLRRQMHYRYATGAWDYLP